MSRTIRNVRYDYSDQVVLVTGAGRGQGRAHALGFAAAGAAVIVVDVATDIDTIPYGLASKDELDAVAAEIEALDARCLPIVCDVRSGSAVDAMVAAALREFGRIDILINNAS